MIVSVAIPCYKSEKFIAKVVDEIKKEITKEEGFDYQIILVNDYPFDNTFSVIKEICEKDSKIIGINLSRNFGQAAAKMAAMPYVKGDVLVFMDDDGQHPASGILSLVNKVSEGYDVVYAYFKSKQHSFFKRFTSKLNAKIAEINGTRAKGIHASSFFALSRFSVDAYQEYNSPFPSPMGYLNTLIGRVTEIEMEHRPRLEGLSGYNLKKLLKLWLNGFTNFSVVPLRAITTLGAAFACVGFLKGIDVAMRKILHPAMMQGYASTMCALLILGGIILIALGMIGEYIGRIYMTVSNLQQYRVREVYQKSNEEKMESTLAKSKM